MPRQPAEETAALPEAAGVRNRDVDLIKIEILAEEFSAAMMMDTHGFPAGIGLIVHSCKRKGMRGTCL